MTDENINQLNTPDEDLLPTEDELTVLKRRATSMNIRFHPNIGLDALREKVNSAINGTASKDADEVTEPLKAEAPRELTLNERRNNAVKEATKLVRIRVTCMNPNKRDWPGEIFTVSNALIGTHKKYVPFNNTEGWHVPYVIYQAIKDRMCQIFVTSTANNGQRTKRAQLINEFAVEILPQLTEAELKELAQRQLMASGAAQ